MTDAADMEHRAALEWRASGRRLYGYAAKFGVEARIGRFTEKIAPGAFAASLAARPDILALRDHDPGVVLGRTRSGTLRLTEDATGLRFEIDTPDTQAGRDVLALAERGDLGGMSFGFVTVKERWDGDRRTLDAVDLREVSVVSAWPAYPDTEIAARSRAAGDAKRELACMRRFLETL